MPCLVSTLPRQYELTLAGPAEYLSFATIQAARQFFFKHRMKLPQLLTDMVGIVSTVRRTFSILTNRAYKVSYNQPHQDENVCIGSSTCFW